MRSGKETRFEGPFPAEIEPLARELNALLESNQQIIERARTQVGNLAHALKTPLSVVINEARANRTPFAVKIAEQAQIMRSQVNHYLDRARIAAKVDVIGAVTDVGPAITRLVRAMRRIHGDRGISLDCAGLDGARFKGEQQDLEEIVGNLVDNACKWASSRVAIEVGLEQPAPDRNVLRVVVDDDGPGLTPAERAQVAQRGKRLDQSKPGSGLGLAIVLELATLYGGNLTLGSSPIGGLRAQLTLPAG